MKGFFIKLPNGSLMPHDEDTRRYIDRREAGQVISAEIKMARNYENHKRFFKFLEVTFGMQDHFDEPEAYRKWLTMKAGWFDTIVAPNGNTIFLPQSIAFENMQEDEFKRLFSTAIDVFLKQFGKGLTENDVLQAIAFV